MAVKSKDEALGATNNVNTNNNTVNVNVTTPKTYRPRAIKKKSMTNYAKLIASAIITILVSLSIYYFTQQAQKVNNPANLPVQNQIEGVKQH